MWSLLSSLDLCECSFSFRSRNCGCCCGDLRPEDLCDDFDFREDEEEFLLLLLSPAFGFLGEPYEELWECGDSGSESLGCSFATGSSIVCLTGFVSL